MVFDHSGNEVGQHQLEHQQIMPRAGWLEHDPAKPRFLVTESGVGYRLKTD